MMGEPAAPVQRLASDERAIAALAAEFRPSLLRYFSRRIRNQNEVEDLVQEVFVRLVRRRHTLDMERVRGYVFQTASSVLIDWLRQPAVRRASAHQPFDAEEHGGHAFAPDRVMQARHDLAQALEVVEQLPERTHTIFILCRFEGMTYPEIASCVGISVSAVEKHMRRAMLALMEQLGE
jgi:RNA polymerase sigma-70 factor (ECF subfamily)